MLNTQRITDKKKEAQIVKKKRELQAALRPVPQISKNSKRIVSQNKAYTPIYKRLQQVIEEQEVELKRLKVSINNERHNKKIVKSSKPNKIKKKDLCFDPTSIKSMIFKYDPFKELNSWKETTEDMEFKANCTFQPNTNKKFARFNFDNRPVVERLTESCEPLSRLMNNKKSRTPIKPRINCFF